ncbi:MAG: hypothetical protein ACREPK_09895 [Rhodanobacteraceae bacterium]
MFILSSPALPRNPLMRALVLIAGVVLLAGLMAMGLLIGAIVVTGATVAMLVRRWLGGRRRRRADPNIIEGEFTIVSSRQRSRLASGE